MGQVGSWIRIFQVGEVVFTVLMLEKRQLQQALPIWESVNLVTVKYTCRRIIFYAVKPTG